MRHISNLTTTDIVCPSSKCKYADRH